MEQMKFPELSDRVFLLYTEGKYLDALQLVEQNEGRFPEHSARTTFWKMCLLSRSGHSEDIISVFQKALDAGLWWAENQFIDSDLDAVRDLPGFKQLVAVSQQKYEEVRAHIKRDQTILLPEPPESGKYPLLIALHGRNGNKDAHLEHWEVARQRGWLVLSVQSTQPLFSGSYCWDDPALGLADLYSYYDEIRQKYQIDPERVVIAGFSQGSGMGIYAMLSGEIPACGFIGIGTFIDDPEWLTPFAGQAGSVRGYFIVGEKDHTLDRTRAIQKILKEKDIKFGEEVHPELGHEFPADFETSFDKAIKFLFTEQE